MQQQGASLSFEVHEDGSFDIVGGSLRLSRCYPAIDTIPVRAVSLSVSRRGDATEIRYGLEHGMVELELLAAADSLVVRSRLTGVSNAPWSVQPCVGQVVGAASYFTQGLGFSGPSGFVRLDDKRPSSFDSYLASGVRAGDGSVLCFVATDHRNYLQKTTFFDRQGRRGLTSRHLERQSVFAEIGFSTENVPLESGELVLPDLHFRGGDDAFSTLADMARDIAGEMNARTHRSPRFHYCSWYYRGPYFNRQDLDGLLDGLRKTEPRVPIQSVQIDDGYCHTYGDWLIPNERWPGGMEAAFGAIREAGFLPGVWVGPFMVGNRSELYRDHPDWVVRDHDGRPIPEWKRFDGTHHDQEVYALDASHPDAFEYLRTVFRTMRQWGATFFKTDFMDWGLKDTAKVRRHDTRRTSVQVFRDVLQMIRDQIGEESYWLACISPYAPFVGFADGMRIANDVGSTWSEGGIGNMLHESETDQYFNNVLWQNDPDALYLRHFHIGHDDAAIRALAYWHGILGGSINTSDSFHLLRPDRLALWRFLRPQKTRWTARVPYWGSDRKYKVAVRDYPDLGSSAALILNPTREPMTVRVPVSDLIGSEAAHAFEWSPEGATPAGRMNQIIVELAPHEGKLFYLSPEGSPPPIGLTLGGAREETSIH